MRGWVQQFGAHVAAVDFEGARTLFADDVIAFGTWSEVLDGREELEAAQWRKVWPTIEDFAFDLDATRAIVSTDRGQAAVVAPWSSTGFSPDGAPFDRPGRATFVLRRTGAEQEWRCVHSHFSLSRDVPQRSHRRPV